MSEDRFGLDLTDDEENDDFDDDGLPEMQGTLSKWTNYLHGWQDRYIVLKEGTLSYYKSETETAFGCRGAVSINKATVIPHQFDECRFDVTVNDCLWYLRARNEDDRQYWIDSIDVHKQAESGYGSENNLRRHGSIMSLTSCASLSTASASSFKRGRGLREKLAEMDTFRDILCRQVDTLQSYFDSCASAVAHGTVHDSLYQDMAMISQEENLVVRETHPHWPIVDNLAEHDDIDDVDDYDMPKADTASDTPSEGWREKDLASLLYQHGGHSLDFKGEALTFKATTAGILETLSHCTELMTQREDAWRKRLEREVDKRKKIEEAYKSVRADHQKHIVIGGPDYEEGPHCSIKEDEFFDAVDAALDKMEKEEEKKVFTGEETPPNISLAPTNRYYKEINQVVNDHLYHLDEKTNTGDDTWILIAEEGEMRVFKRELEDNGIVIDPLKAVHTVKGITGHEVCLHFWNICYRMDWEGSLDSCEVVEWLAEDTFITRNIIKRVWPTAQRDALFWSHMRHIPKESDELPDTWIVVNYSTDHEDCPANKFVRIKMNVSLICQTIINPPKGDTVTREDISCKISYTANVNPGGWAPASVLRAVYKREYPKFVKRFTQYVKDTVKDKPIML